MSRVGLAGIASLIVASASAKTAAPLAQCQPVNFGGATVCAVDMSRYTHSASVAMPVCPSGVTSTGGPLLCEQSFAAALTDARRYFAAAGSASRSYLITIPSGAYDLSSQGTVLPASQGVIDVSGIAPASSGCLDAAAAATGTVTLSGNPCLIISGAGADKTTLTTANGGDGDLRPQRVARAD